MMVAEGIVYLLEAIEIQEKNRHILLCSGGNGQRSLQALPEQEAIRKISQGVMAYPILQSPLGVLPLQELADRSGDSRHGSHELLILLSRLGAEELEDGMKPACTRDRKTESGV